MSWIAWVIIGIISLNVLFVLILWLAMKAEDQNKQND